MSNTVIRTNVMALNSHRNLGMVGNQQARASRNLSSGFRINSAADDAAGLGISEKMRAQIRGLDQASRNAQDGISLIQTAEGAMGTINEMVVRIRELVVQASNDTNAHDETNAATWSQSDRTRIQDEINQLLAEIDATADRTQFNTRNLIDGSLGGIATHTRGMIADFIGQNGALVANFRAAEDDIAEASADLAMYRSQFEIATNQANEILNRSTETYVRNLLENIASRWINSITNNPNADSSASAEYEFLQNALNGHFGFTFDMENILGIDDADALDDLGGLASLQAGADGWDGITFAQSDLRDDFAEARADIIAGDTSIAITDWDDVADYVFGAGTGSFRYEIENLETDLADALQDRADALAALDAVLNNVDNQALRARFQNSEQMLRAFDSEGEDLWFHVGANVGQGVRLSIGAVNVSALNDVGLSAPGQIQTGFSFEDLRSDDTSFASAGQGVMRVSGEEINQFITAIDFALSHVNAERSNLGAMQNRLEFTIENLDVASENLSAAESRVRDADMALEMMRLTQANVLQQAATAMLAQANQAPQNVLQLLG